MSSSRTPASRWLIAIVVIHLVISFIHGAAHSGAQVFLSQTGNLFVWVVILAGPIVGLIVQQFFRAVGTWLTTLTMAGALVFGIVNHFVLDSGDHVQHVTGPWRMTFALTAALLALTEAAGVGVGLRAAAEERRTP